MNSASFSDLDLDPQLISCVIWKKLSICMRILWCFCILSISENKWGIDSNNKWHFYSALKITKCFYIHISWECHSHSVMEVSLFHRLQCCYNIYVYRERTIHLIHMLATSSNLENVPFPRKQRQFLVLSKKF